MAAMQNGSELERLLKMSKKYVEVYPMFTKE